MPEEQPETADYPSTSTLNISTRDDFADISRLSSPQIPSFPSSAAPNKPVDDDDQIEMILLEVQAEQSRVAERLSELQKYSTEILNLKYAPAYGILSLTPISP